MNSSLFVFKKNAKTSGAVVRDKHKNVPAQFQSVVGGRIKRIDDTQKYRKSVRLIAFDDARAISPSPGPASFQPPVQNPAEGKTQLRRLQLQRWKEDKEKKRKEQAADKTKKKPFIVGTVKAPMTFQPPPPVNVPSTSRVLRSHIHSNIKDNKAIPTKVKDNKFSNPTVKEKYTTNYVQSKKKAPSKKSFAPANAPFRPPQLKQASIPVITRYKAQNNMTMAFEPKDYKDNQVKRKSKGMVERPNEVASSLTPVRNNKVMKKSSPRMQTPKVIRTSTSPRSESLTEMKLRTPENTTSVKVKISPAITVSRGKDAARREMKEKLADGYCADDGGDPDTIEHFRKQLDSEAIRMSEICNTWDTYMEENDLDERVQEQIRAAIGQARLLLSNKSKMQQFRNLVEQCAGMFSATAEGPVHAADLQGFWDLVFLQISDVDIRFKKLEQARDHNWVEEVVQPAKKAVSKKIKKKPPGKAASSRIREVIEAARKAAQENNSNKTEQLEVNGSVDQKTFEGGFFQVQSPVRSGPFNITPAKSNTMLKTVLSSEVKNNVSKAMMRASIIARATAQTTDQEPETPLTMTFAVPTRSILKTPNTSTIERKKTKSVLFNDHDSSMIFNDSMMSGIIPIPKTPEIDKKNSIRPATPHAKTLFLSPLNKCKDNLKENLQPDELKNSSEETYHMKDVPILPKSIKSYSDTVKIGLAQHTKATAKSADVSPIRTRKSNRKNKQNSPEEKTVALNDIQNDTTINHVLHKIQEKKTRKSKRTVKDSIFKMNDNVNTPQLGTPQDSPRKSKTSPRTRLRSKKVSQTDMSKFERDETPTTVAERAFKELSLLNDSSFKNFLPENVTPSRCVTRSLRRSLWEHELEG